MSCPASLGRSLLVCFPVVCAWLRRLFGVPLQEPEAATPFPVFIQRVMHMQISEDAWPAESFWDKLRPSVLSTFLDKGKGDIDAFIMDVVCAKSMLICQSAENAKDAIKDLLSMAIHLREQVRQPGCSSGSGARLGQPRLLFLRALFFVFSLRVLRLSKLASKPCSPVTPIWLFAFSVPETHISFALLHGRVPRSAPMRHFSVVHAELAEMKKLLLRGQGDPAVLEAALEHWPTTKLASAIATYPVGRTVISDARAAVQTLNDKVKNTADIKAKMEIATEQLSMSDVQEVNAMPQKRECLIDPDNILQSRWVLDLLSRMLREFFGTYIEQSKPRENASYFKKWVKLLSECVAMHNFTPDLASYDLTGVYRTLLGNAQFMDQFKEYASFQDISHEYAVNILFGLEKWKADPLLDQAISEHHSETGLLDLSGPPLDGVLPQPSPQLASSGFPESRPRTNFQLVRAVGTRLEGRSIRGGAFGPTQARTCWPAGST